ncbi:COQ9 family protein [Profundibacter sp.]|uniref:COQ9 family protein n=1 Tax=Profundibacter sp. TaxID=3101071 RepID=UPI003D14AD17
MPQNTTPKDALLDAIQPHVAFNGWSDASFKAAVQDAGIDPVVAHAVCPRGAVDLAVAYHKRGDALMLERYAQTDLSEMRYSDRIAALVRMRIEVVEDREVVRKASALFALPKYAAEGARLIWETCDLIWNTLGDTSDDINWYTKRATLSGVYGSTVLFWLGDESEGNAETWEFLDRRIDDVMKIEKLKAKVRDNPLLKGLFAGPLWAMGHVKAPRSQSMQDVPGRWDADKEGAK